MGRIVLGLRAARDNRHEEAREHFAGAAFTPLGELTSGLLTAWSFAQERKLDEALDSLEEAAGGLARITMLYGISPFFLFRLLVQYRIEEKKEITDKNRRDVSEVVTGHLNQQAWVRDWLAGQMEAIAKGLSGFKENVFFHLKGGRALALLLDEEGENDWDTSVVIDPTLPDDEWYALYNQVHDKLLELLRTAKREFLVLASEKAADFKTSCTEALKKIESKEAEEDLDDFVEMQKETAKAEMIDIGIPRRDTVEALEQWHHTKDSILIVTKYDAKIPIPGPLYYVEEYVVMVREALSGRSPSLHKTAKRIQRLANVLDAKDIDATLGEVKKKIPKSLANAQKLVEKKKGRVGRVMTLLLQEFSAGHRLSELAGLARAFDTTFAKAGETPDHDEIPDAVTEGKKKYFREKGGRETTWTDSECDAILEHVAFAQTLAGKLEKHLRTRAEYFGFEDKAAKEPKLRRKNLGQLVKALYTASVFRQEERFEVQVAVAGSHAAFLHADYSRDFVDRIDSLDPVTMIDLRYYCYKKDADAKTVLDFFVKEPLRIYLDQGEIELTKDDLVGMKLAEESKDDEITGEAIYLTWPEEVDFGDGFKYKPVILKISVRQQWPEVSFVWGYPVLSLKDLIRDYVEAAALAGEFETKYRLRGTADILKEMLTHYV